MIIDLSNPWVFFVWYFITAGLLFASYKTKKAKICLIPVIYLLIMLAFSIAKVDDIYNIIIHRVIIFLGLAVSVSFFVVMDEVETRRKFISRVFKNKYKKDKLPSDMEEEDNEGDE